MQTRNFKGPARAGTVPLKPKIRPLQTWPSERSASLAPLEAAPAHGSSSARGQRGADGRGWVWCQESLCAAWPSSNPPPRSRGKRQLREGSFKTPTQSYSQAKSPSSFKGRLRTDLHGGIPHTGSKPFAAPARILGHRAAHGGWDTEWGASHPGQPNAFSSEEKYLLRSLPLQSNPPSANNKGNNRGLNYLPAALGAHGRP